MIISSLKLGCSTAGWSRGGRQGWPADAAVPESLVEHVLGADQRFAQALRKSGGGALGVEAGAVRYRRVAQFVRAPA